MFSLASDFSITPLFTPPGRPHIFGRHLDTISAATMGVDSGLVYGDVATLFGPFLFISLANHITWRGDANDSAYY
jgi:hypothetical protein